MEVRAVLKFDMEYYEPIKNGDKVQTTRKNKKGFEKTNLVIAEFPTGQKLLLQIYENYSIPFGRLDDFDAHLEGYTSLRELKKDLLEYYPDIDRDTTMYCYRFLVVMELK